MAPVQRKRGSRKTLNNVEEEPFEIPKVYVGKQMITRSKSKYLESFGIKECFVALKKSVHAEALQYLQNQERQQNQTPARICKRRGTNAGGLLFSVEGEILETGFDFLGEVEHATTQKENPIPQNAEYQMVEFSNVDQQKQPTPSTSKHEKTSSTLKHPRGGVYLNPFQRTRNIPFSINCRRSSVHVMSTVPFTVKQNEDGRSSTSVTSAPVAAVDGNNEELEKLNYSGESDVSSGMIFENVSAEISADNDSIIELNPSTAVAVVRDDENVLVNISNPHDTQKDGVLIEFSDDENDDSRSSTAIAAVPVHTIGNVLANIGFVDNSHDSDNDGVLNESGILIEFSDDENDSSTAVATVPLDGCTTSQQFSSNASTIGNSQENGLPGTSKINTGNKLVLGFSLDSGANTTIVSKEVTDTKKTNNGVEVLENILLKPATNGLNSSAAVATVSVGRKPVPDLVPIETSNGKIYRQKKRKRANSIFSGKLSVINEDSENIEPSESSVIRKWIRRVSL